MESGLSSILPLIPRKTQYPYSTKPAYQIQADFVEARESFYADFSSLLPVSPSYYDRRFPAAAKADAGKAPDCVKSNRLSLARYCPQPLEGEFCKKRHNISVKCFGVVMTETRDCFVVGSEILHQPNNLKIAMCFTFETSAGADTVKVTIYIYSLSMS